jgi:hypothetical protein
MNDVLQSSEDLKAIKQYMEKSSRFISLSGLSGISAGICALIGAYLAYPYIIGTKENLINISVGVLLAMSENYLIVFYTWIFWIAMGTFLAALLTSFIFTYRKSKRQKLPIWGTTARRMLFNLAIPLAVGAVFLFRMIYFDAYALLAPGCLLFYGLALLNASKYTLQEIRWLGISQILVGLINLVFLDYGIYFWAFGFGILHILYGSYMWWTYERNEESA